ncbi:MAG: BON domain-containing protein [Terriglobales bacterium]
MPRAHRIAFTFLSVVVALVVGTTGCARRRDNGEVVSDVQNRIRADRQLTMGRLQVTGTNNVITLAGYVVSNEQRAAAVHDAQQVEGVKTIVDNLRLVGSTPRLTPVPLKPSALVKRASRSSMPGRVLVARRISLADSAPRPSHEAAPSDSVSITMEPVPSVAPAVVGSSDVPSIVPRPASVILTDAAEKIVVPDGTLLAIRLNESLNSELNEKGDTFIASLASPILVGDRVVVPEGAGIKGRVVEVESAGRFSGRPSILIEMTRLGFNGNSYDLHTDQYSKKGSSRSVRSAATIGGGAGLGAILGGILGGGRGAAIGAMIGAGAGTGVESAGKGAVVQLPAESILSFRLRAPLTVTPASMLQLDRSTDPGSDSLPDDDRPVLKRRPGSVPLETTTTEEPPTN